ncbi:MAG: hypothetical protein HC764_14070 [Pleurocapsa sp. CRU_1_2]|nr:hypothetical protein [Pleurocapsa sp. CRU_1_2]
MMEFSSREAQSELDVLKELIEQGNAIAILENLILWRSLPSPGITCKTYFSDPIEQNRSYSSWKH